MPSPICFLLSDNGSLRPDATISLRRLASELSARTGETVHPVSILHSDKIDPACLGGEPAWTFEPFVLAKRREGLDRFCVTPLFFGPSAAPYEFLPQRVAAIRAGHDWPELEVRVAPCLVDTSDPGDTRVARILADAIESTSRDHGLSGAAVAVCDHGAPRAGVTDVRNHLAAQLRTLVEPGSFPAVEACSMERRPGDEYAFNEPLLESLLGPPPFDREVVVSMLFFQPGRHAGEGGDIAQICEGAESAHPGLRVFRTPLVGAHPGLLPILEERHRQGLASAPVG